MTTTVREILLGTPTCQCLLYKKGDTIHLIETHLTVAVGSYSPLSAEML